MHRGQIDEAERGLRDAIARFDRAGMTLYAASARHALAAHLGTGGEMLSSVAKNAFDAQGVVAPATFASLLATGLVRRTA